MVTGGGLSRRRTKMKEDRPNHMRALFYSHDTVGLGHLRRTLLLSSGLKERLGDLTTLLITGSAMAQGFRIPDGIDYIKLPCVKKLGNEQYEARSLDLPFDVTLRLREEIILGVTATYKPDIFFVDTVPLGMKGEIRKTLEYLRCDSPWTTVVLSMRDILDDRAHIVPLWRERGIFEAIEQFYDRVYIYGLPVVFNPLEEYDWPETLRMRARFCGYLPRPVDREASAEIRRGLSSREKLILVTVGGGVDGFPIIESYLRALPKISASSPVSSLIVLGPEMGSEESKLLVLGSPGNERVKFLEFCDDLLPYIDAADLVVSMGGYNTISEIVSLGKKAVVVPRVNPRREQLIRSERLQDLGFLTMIHPSELTPSRLASEINSLLLSERIAPLATLDFTGIQNLVNEVQTLLAGRGREDWKWKRETTPWIRRNAV
jgi:predicted glycosyltransferase